MTYISNQKNVCFFIYLIKIHWIILTNFDCGKIAGVAGRDGSGTELLWEWDGTGLKLCGSGTGRESKFSKFGALARAQCKPGLSALHRITCFWSIFMYFVGMYWVHIFRKLEFFCKKRQICVKLFHFQTRVKKQNEWHSFELNYRDWVAIKKNHWNDSSIF
jgi:hypothetical protein